MIKFVVIAKKASFWEIVDGKQKRISKARFDAIMAQKVVKTETRENETVFYVEEREEVELFSFAELSKTTQNAVINANRYLLVEYENWFDYLKDNFHKTLELLGFFNINSLFGMHGISFTADWDAKLIVNAPDKWQTDKEYKCFAPFMQIMGKLGSRAKIYHGCYITADNELDVPVLEELYNNICCGYYNKLLKEYNYVISDVALQEHFFGCYWLKYTKNGLCINGGK